MIVFATLLPIYARVAESFAVAIQLSPIRSSWEELFCAIVSKLFGPLVPTPTFPLASITKGVVSGEVESSTIKEGAEPVLVTESFAYGEVVPMPMLPEVVIRIVSPAALLKVSVEAERASGKYAPASRLYDVR